MAERPDEIRLDPDARDPDERDDDEGPDGDGGRRSMPGYRPHQPPQRALDTSGNASPFSNELIFVC